MHNGQNRNMTSETLQCWMSKTLRALCGSGVLSDASRATVFTRSLLRSLVFVPGSNRSWHSNGYTHKTRLGSLVGAQQRSK